MLSYTTQDVPFIYFLPLRDQSLLLFPSNILKEIVPVFYDSLHVVLSRQASLSYVTTIQPTWIQLVCVFDICGETSGTDEAMAPEIQRWAFKMILAGHENHFQDSLFFSNGTLCRCLSDKSHCFIDIPLLVLIVGQINNFFIFCYGNVFSNESTFFACHLRSRIHI